MTLEICCHEVFGRVSKKHDNVVHQYTDPKDNKEDGGRNWGKVFMTSTRSMTGVLLQGLYTSCIEDALRRSIRYRNLRSCNIRSYLLWKYSYLIEMKKLWYKAF